MTPRLRTLAVACLLVVFGGASAAEEGTGGRITVAVEPREATVGDPIATTVTVDVPPGAQAAPDPIGPELGKFSVLSGAWRESEGASGGRRWTWTGTIAAYETGKLAVPGIAVTVRGPEGEKILQSEPADVSIRSVLPASGADGKAVEPADLKPPASIPPDYTVLKTALGIVAGLLALAAAAWWLHRRYASRLSAVPAPEDPFRRVPPHVWAYEELKRLLEQRLAEDGKIDLFFAELSHIVKQYLGGRYRIDLMERTTEEVPPLLAQAGAPREPVRSARSLLERCDLVKFARVWPDAEKCRTEIEEAYRIVDATRPADASAPEAGRGAA